TTIGSKVCQISRKENEFLYKINVYEGGSRNERCFELMQLNKVYLFDKIRKVTPGIKGGSCMVHGIRLTENKHSGKNSVKSHHHQVHQILYVLENKSEITFNNQKYSFSQDSLAFIPPYSDHSITSDAKMTVLVLEFDLGKLDSDIKNILIQQHFDETRLIELNPFEAGNVRQLLRRMFYEQSQADTINLLAAKIYLEELLLILLRTQEESNITDANVLRAERLRDYLDTNYFEIS